MKTPAQIAAETWGEGTGFPTGFGPAMVEMIAAGIEADRAQRHDDLDPYDSDRVYARHETDDTPDTEDEWCNAVRDYFICTRPVNHRANHAAGTGHHIAHVWED